MSTESLTLFSAKSSPWRTPTKMTKTDYLSVNVNVTGSALLNTDWSPATSCSSLSDFSALSSNPCSPHRSAKRAWPKRRSSLSTSEFSYGDDGDEEELQEWLRREKVEPNRMTREKTHAGRRYQSVRSRTPSPEKTAEKNVREKVAAPLYPNCDAHVWLRSCEKEIIEPIDGHPTGQIPRWLKGSLLRNGPGNLRVGAMRFNHLFDSSALLHGFAICDGRVTYQCRFIQTDTFKRNMAANRIVVTEFGTTSVPDPCHSIFQRISAIFRPGEWSDNAMISIYPFGDEYFAFTEYPVIHSINVDTLATQRKLNVADYTGIVSHSSHPHILDDGTIFNLGLTITKTGPHYNIIRFPSGAANNTPQNDAMFEQAHIVATIPSRWKLYPGYMHTFGLTDRFFVIVEQPLSVSVPEMIRSQIRAKPLAGNFKWFADQSTCIYLVSRDTGQLVQTYETEAFFYLHVINAYEARSNCDHDQTDGGVGGRDYVVLDICCYKDPAMLDCMYIEAMENMQRNPDYARMFRGKPQRFVLPLLRADDMVAKRRRPTMLRSISITNLFSRLNGGISVKRVKTMSRSESETQSIRYRSIDWIDRTGEEDRQDSFDDAAEEVVNLVQLPGSMAEAYLRAGTSNVFCIPELLCDLGCETPRIYYELHMGKAYRYFYAISSDVDADNPGTLIKVDVQHKTRKTWCEKNCYPSEPIFVPSPQCEAEDDGVVLAAMVWGDFDENRVGLLVLCAKTWTELGRTEFRTPGPVPKCLHGWFAAAKD